MFNCNYFFYLSNLYISILCVHALVYCKKILQKQKYCVLLYSKIEAV
jgi:hypothetical protein